jgi:hypothetical protein
VLGINHQNIIEMAQGHISLSATQRDTQQEGINNYAYFFTYIIQLTNNSNQSCI